MNEERKKELLWLFNEKAPLAKFFGMKLAYGDEETAEITLPYNPNLNHALGGIHGGVYATMLDCAGWFAVAACHERSHWVATSELSIRLLKPVMRSDLKAVGRLLHRGKRQGVAEMHLYDGEGKMVGQATGTFILMPQVRIQKDDASLEKGN